MLQPVVSKFSGSRLWSRNRLVPFQNKTTVHRLEAPNTGKFQRLGESAYALTDTTPALNGKLPMSDEDEDRVEERLPTGKRGYPTIRNGISDKQDVVVAREAEMV